MQQIGAVSQWYMHLPAEGKRLVQIPLLEAVEALFLDIIPVIKWLCRFRTKNEHMSRTLEGKKTLVDSETEACSHTSPLVVCYGRGTTPLLLL